jgi:excisionase family DNA binding protein
MATVPFRFRPQTTANTEAQTIMQPIALTIDQIGEMGGPKRDKAYKEIAAGRLRAVKVGRATRILVTDFQSYLASLPTIEPKGGAQDDVLHGQRHGQQRRRRRSPTKSSR